MKREDWKNFFLIWLLLSGIVLAAGALLLNYLINLPAILQFVVHVEDRQALAFSYQIAKVGCCVSGLSGFVIGLCLLPVYRLCK